MTATVPVNGTALRASLLSLGISDRAFAKESRLGDAVVRGMLLRNEINGSAAIADIARAAETARMTFAHLMDRSEPSHPDDTPDSDVAVLAQVLISQDRMHTNDRLAIALGWTTDRLREAIPMLVKHLAPLGLSVHANSMGTTIRPADRRGHEANKRLNRIKDADDGLNHGTARVLYAAYLGTISATDTGNDRTVKLGELVNRGILELGSGVGQRVQLSSDAAFAFDVE